MRTHKHAGAVWTPTEQGGGPSRNTYSHETIVDALLMDIRDELQTLNGIMRCKNVQIGFRALARIAKQSEVAFKRRVDNAVRKRLARAK